jgi:hypothetical protein
LVEIQDSGGINMGKRNGVVDEAGKAPANTDKTISMNKGEIRKDWLFGAGREFCLLEAGNFNRVVNEECNKFSNRVLQAVDIELKHIRVKGRIGTRVRVDASNEKKNEDEWTREMEMVKKGEGEEGPVE